MKQHKSYMAWIFPVWEPRQRFTSLDVKWMVSEGAQRGPECCPCFLRSSNAFFDSTKYYFSSSVKDLKKLMRIPLVYIWYAIGYSGFNHAICDPSSEDYGWGHQMHPPKSLQSGCKRTEIFSTGFISIFGRNLGRNTFLKCFCVKSGEVLWKDYER